MARQGWRVSAIPDYSAPNAEAELATSGRTKSAVRADATAVARAGTCMYPAAGGGPARGRYANAYRYPFFYLHTADRGTSTRVKRSEHWALLAREQTAAREVAKVEHVLEFRVRLALLLPSLDPSFFLALCLSLTLSAGSRLPYAFVRASRRRDSPRCPDGNRKTAKFRKP